MRYTVYHLTHFRYDAPVSESVMEVRMQPRTESVQRCLRFELATTPRSRVFAYQDPEGNVVHHFDVQARHRELTVVAESVVEFVADITIPESCDRATWALLDDSGTRERFFEFLEPSYFARPTEALVAFGRELGLSREIDPLSLVRNLKHKIYDAFSYVPQSTRVDSPIDDALAARKGVCQDFAHVMIALVRGMGIPCRYVSGYLFHNHLGDERSVDGASHAWVEAWLPALGWIGIDPTNKVLAMDRHIRVAIGRDYHDVPPTRGSFKGNARGELGVAVRVQTTDAPIAPSDVMPALYWAAPEPDIEPPFTDGEEQQQQQQQQQQQ